VIGETDFEQQQILGYVPIEPDGSVKLQVPADVPLALAGGRHRGPQAFQTHTNWLQVRPGERRTCDGCHSPRRGAALNSGPVVNQARGPGAKRWPRSARAARPWPPLRTRLDPAALTLAADPVSTDAWADTTKPA
jgi:hypothetical protein